MKQFDNNELSILNYLVAYYIAVEGTRLDEDDNELLHTLKEKIYTIKEKVKNDISKEYLVNI